MENLTFGTIHSGFAKLSHVDSSTCGRVIKVNGQPIKKRYETDIKFHADMNFSMIRCWDWGLAERPQFYRHCEYMVCEHILKTVPAHSIPDGHIAILSENEQIVSLPNPEYSTASIVKEQQIRPIPELKLVEAYGITAKKNYKLTLPIVSWPKQTTL